MNRMHGIIFAYEQRGELRELTERRTAASMPFGGRYRAVDFALSNLLNAGVTDVGMVLHGRYQSMLDHVGSGKVCGAACTCCLPSTTFTSGASRPSGAKWKPLPASGTT